MGSEGEQQRIVYEMTSVTYVTITMMMQRSEKTFFDLFGQRQQHNDEAGMRIYVLHRQRLQLHTDGLALEGLDKGGLVRLNKDGWFCLNKDGWFRLNKDGLVTS